MKKKPILDVRTLVLSDVHLGSPDCKIHELNLLLRHVRCRKLILNGDIIDGWSLLRRSGIWTADHTRFVRRVLKMAEQHRTEVIYLSGNHDDILRRFLPLRLDLLRIESEHVHETEGGRFLVIHGDALDIVTRNHRWLAVLGSVGYGALLRVNRVYDRWRKWRGLEQYSISKEIKARVKSAVNFIGRFEEELPALARRRGCHGVICGHIHTPADRMIGGIRYLNSGDWLESLTAVVEQLDGRFRILRFDEFRNTFAEAVALRFAARSERLRARGRVSAPPAVSAGAA